MKKIIVLILSLIIIFVGCKQPQKQPTPNDNDIVETPQQEDDLKPDAALMEQLYADKKFMSYLNSIPIFSVDELNNKTEAELLGIVDFFAWSDFAKEYLPDYSKVYTEYYITDEEFENYLEFLGVTKTINHDSNDSSYPHENGRYDFSTGHGLPWTLDVLQSCSKTENGLYVKYLEYDLYGIIDYPEFEGKSREELLEIYKKGNDDRLKPTATYEVWLKESTSPNGYYVVDKFIK